MYETSLQVFALLAVPGVISCLIHACLRRYFIAVVLSAFICTVLFPLFSYIEMGYLDPLLVLGLIQIFATSSIVSLIVGVPFLLGRRKRKEI